MNADQHAYKLFQSTMKSGILPSVMLFYGVEDYLVRWALETLKSKVIHPASAAMDQAVFSERKAQNDELIAACETLPVLSAKRLVIVEDCDAFSMAKGTDAQEDERLRAAQSNRAAANDELSNYIRSVPDSCLLVFLCANVDKRTKAYKAVRDTGIAFDFSTLDRATLAGFVNKRINEAGKSVSRDTFNYLVERTGYLEKDSAYTLSHLLNDIAKAAAHSQSDEVKAEDFEAVMTADASHDAFALLEAAFTGEKALALALWRQRCNALLPGETGREIFRMIALICSQLEMTLIARERMADGQNAKDLATAMGVHPYRLRKALEAARPKSTESLFDNLLAAYDLEQQIKSGLLSGETAVELFIACV